MLSSGLGVAPAELTDPESFPAQKTRGHACKSRPARCSAQGPRGQGPLQTKPQGWRTGSWVPSTSRPPCVCFSGPPRPWHSRLSLSPCQGIGNTFQGGANCITFVLCTRTVRTRLLSLCSCCCPQASAAAESPLGPPRPLRPPQRAGESQGPSRAADELPST